MSFKRSIQPTIGYFYARGGDEAALAPVPVIRQRLRATLSNFSERDQAEKESGDAKSAGRANLQTIEMAILPGDCAEVVLRFSVQFLANAMRAYSCNDESVLATLDRFSSAYAARGGFTELARRYFANLATGRFLWRNESAQDKAITLRIDELKATFAPALYDYSLEQFAEQQDVIEQFVARIAEALTNRRKPAVMHVEAVGYLGAGAEVFPSQEFGAEEKGEKISRVLAAITTADGTRQAIFHSQKIGNAIRRIDTWYRDGAEDYPLPVEPFGIDQTFSRAYRVEGKPKNDFYTLVENNLTDYIAALEAGSDITGDMHFVAACLVRGGVYSGKKGAK
nr:type I-F CRISPR-associated protein Csy3 [Natronocella acetinitrilica]